jgi:valyl-tRNA synthetase
LTPRLIFGNLKGMKQELDKSYNPALHEDSIYQKWENSGCFNPDNLQLNADAPSYTVILPPPNITAKLHLGHSAMLAIEDLMVRYHRQQGERVLWLPGTDHAAIATQNMVEKKMLAEKQLTRHDLGKEKFLIEVDKFVKETQNTILGQIRKMGASLDWSRLAFTLDEDRQESVRRMFVDMYEAGVIYRGERLVNWCPRCHSTLADDEVEYKEQKTILYTFKYSHDCPITIATTRPETKLGDTAIAVNPNDSRYQSEIAKTYNLDFCGQALNLKVVADEQVEADFGTGALGVTPAHSEIDWQMAQKHQLSTIKVIDEDARILPGFGVYAGLTAKEAREKIVTELKARGLMEKEEEIDHNLSCCYRCDTPIEPLPSKQWFVAVDKPLVKLGNKSMKAAALELSLNKELEFIPNRFEKRYQDWMTNLHDWCISRQIWFGHSIPAWYRGDEVYVGLNAPSGSDWQQDEDTLDTWFSSGMWTFSTLGWPRNYQNQIKQNDLAKFHPTQVLETGYEILTLWVSRMIMMSLFALGEKPFSKVYLHGTILDSNGKKMSKSKGNGVDPLEVIDKYGADAVRLSLLMGSTPGNDARYNEEKIESKRNFINKLWNISRFILSNIQSDNLKIKDLQPVPKSLADKWIMAELNQVVRESTLLLNNYDFSAASELLYDYTWNKLADWYLEIAKIEGNKDEILLHILKTLLIMWHPFIPFVTETIWQSFSDSLLMTTAWPQARDEAIVSPSDFIFIQEAIVAIRNARSANKIEPARKVKALVAGAQANLLLEQAHLIIGLKTGVESLELVHQNIEDKAIKIVLGVTEIYLLGAIDPEKEQQRLLKEQKQLTQIISALKHRLENKDFVNKAPANVVSVEKEKLEKYQFELEQINKTLSKE